MESDEPTHVKTIKFHLQDVEHIVKTEDIAPNMTLNSYIRNVLNLTGTKYMCLEGGCGACVVVLQSKDPVTNKNIFLAVNSCLVSIMSCHGWKIYTIEGIRPSPTALHPIQSSLAKFNGSQCGFCTSGMLMNMYALYESNKLTMKEVENGFSGNICRCTGYRSILTAFKSLCKDADNKVLGEIPDIEDIKLCFKSNCHQQCLKMADESNTEPLYHLFEDTKWIKVYTLKDLLDTINKYSDVKYMLVAGNTAKGVYKSYGKSVEVYIEVTSVPELTTNQLKDGKLILGANTSLANTIEIFNNTGAANAKLSYLKKMADHISLVANVPVRNIGTLAGNLMIKHDHNEFPSDIFLILETVGATITIINTDGDETNIPPREFYKTNMTKKLIKQITLYSLNDNFVYESFKIMPRAQNVHAIVNAGFLLNLNKDQTLKSISIIFGNINPSFVHATNTENLLTGKKIFDNNILQKAYASLEKEIVADNSSPDPSPEFRKQLAVALFYKAVLKMAPDSKLSSVNKSGGTVLKRPISSGVQDYQTKKSLYPLTEPISKIEIKAQCTGTAEYIMDMPDLPHQLYAAFVLAKARPNSIIKNVDPSKALRMKDVVAFYDKKDIPGKNSFTTVKLLGIDEEIFCSGTVGYYCQPLGLIVGKSQEVVNEAVDLVEVTYDESKDTPLLNVRDILKAHKTSKIKEQMTYVRKEKGKNTKHVIKGTYDIYQQYHFHMETQICLAVPNENGLDVYASTQWMALNQSAIGNMLNIPGSRISVHVRRCGGAFGGKITRNALIACGASLPAYLLHQPVKLILSLETNMQIIGKRFPLTVDYEAGVDDQGRIQYLNLDCYTDVGYILSDSPLSYVLSGLISNYDSNRFRITLYCGVTDTYANTAARAPGHCEGIGCIESILDHIANTINIDPIAVRSVNIVKEKPLLKYIAELKSWAEIDKRKNEIKTFNQANRWKKKGLAVAIMAFQLEVTGPFSVLISIFVEDGSVAITHGGIEIGQGINTKAVQVCAYKLGISIDKVTVNPSKSSVTPNNLSTGYSITTEAICYGVLQACDQILDRMRPYRDDNTDASWEELVYLCHTKNVDLSAIGFYAPKSPGTGDYVIYGSAATEVTVDILTGQHIINRVDIIEDTGQSMSPEIDIGQVEGAFVMGIGLYTTEQIIYDSDGQVLTNNTWTYYPPGALDIPVDFRVKFPKDNINPVGVLKSKALAEPPLCLSISVPMAIRNAVGSARINAKQNVDTWFPVDGATTVETVFMNSLNDPSQYVL